MGYQIPVVEQLLVDAINHAEDTFVVVQLGARYGNQLVSSARHLRLQAPQLKRVLIGVEASESGYTNLMKRMTESGLDAPPNVFLRAAISDLETTVSFVDKGAGGHMEHLRYYKQEQHAGAAAQDMPNATQAPMETVRTTTIAVILREVDHVDFLEMDIQGAEYLAIPASMASINDKVKMICIRTHFVRTDGLLRNEKDLEAYFENLGWQKVLVLYNQTPIWFDGKLQPLSDGLQCWVNTNLREACDGRYS